MPTSKIPGGGFATRTYAYGLYGVPRQVYLEIGLDAHLERPTPPGLDSCVGDIFLAVPTQRHCPKAPRLHGPYALLPAPDFVAFEGVTWGGGNSISSEFP